MKREIIFRGKRLDNCEWVYGDLEYSRITEAVFIHTYDPITKEYARQFRVEPNTVGQFTGLTDKNDKKIFEGDIVKGQWFYDKEMSPHPVCFHERQLQWVIQLPNCIVPFYEMDTIEVVGNIHDNPELIKTKQQ